MNEGEGHRDVCVAGTEETEMERDSLAALCSALLYTLHAQSSGIGFPASTVDLGTPVTPSLSGSSSATTVQFLASNLFPPLKRATASPLPLFSITLITGASTFFVAFISKTDFLLFRSPQKHLDD